MKENTKKMTEGSALKLILGFSIPMLAGMLFQQMYSLVDTIIVGQTLGDEALAAVGSTGSINFLINGFCMGICSGFAIPVAQRFGAEYDAYCQNTPRFVPRWRAGWWRVSVPFRWSELRFEAYTLLWWCLVWLFLWFRTC